MSKTIFDITEIQASAKCFLLRLKSSKFYFDRMQDDLQADDESMLDLIVKLEILVMTIDKLPAMVRIAEETAIQEQE